MCKYGVSFETCSRDFYRVRRKLGNKLIEVGFNRYKTHNKNYQGKADAKYFFFRIWIFGFVIYKRSDVNDR